jgi:hypothetical protein
MDDSVANELDRVEAAASQASQSQVRPTHSQAMVSAAVPITPARTTMGSAPAGRSGMPAASSSSLNAAVRLIDLDKSDDLEDPLADADVDWAPSTKSNYHSARVKATTIAPEVIPLSRQPRV